MLDEEETNPSSTHGYCDANRGKRVAATPMEDEVTPQSQKTGSKIKSSKTGSVCRYTVIGQLTRPTCYPLPSNLSLNMF